MKFFPHLSRKAVLLSYLAVSIGSAQRSDADLQRYSEAGRKAVYENRYAEASEAFEKALEINPNLAEIGALLGFTYFQRGLFGKAVPVLEKSLELDPNLPNVDILLAMSRSELGRFKQALPDLEKGFRGSNDPALKRMAGLQLQRAYTGLKRDREAVGTALEMTKLYPEDPEVLYLAGRLFGNFAFLNVQKLSETAPNSVWTHQAAGEAYEAEGQTERAIGEYRKVLELDPGRPGIHFRLGRALLGLSQQPDALAKAMKEFTRELEVDPTNANAAYELAEIHRKRGEFEKALALFERAVEHYPEFAEAHLGLGGVLTSMGKPERGLTHLQAAASINRENEVAFYRMAQAYRALGWTAELKQALAEYQRLRREKSQRSSTGPVREEVTRQQVETESKP